MNTNKFYELHLDDKFEILETKGAHHKFLVRCKKCNKEHWHDDGILRKPNQKVMYCPYCKNTNFVSKAKQHIKKGTPEFVEQIASMYSSGKEQKEIVETTGQTYCVVRYWLKKRGLYDPARRVHNTYQQTQSREAENRTKQRVESLGFEYVGGYTSRRERVTLRCKECGETFERLADSGRRYGIRCPACQLRKREEQQAIKEARTIARRQQVEIEQEQRRQKKIEERDRFLKEKHVCKECGRTFTYLSYCTNKGISTDCISNTVFCSDGCRRENEKKSRRQYQREHKIHGRHIRRAKKYGVEYDRSITLDKLIKRDGLNCSICGLICIYSGDSNADLYPSIDHIVPLSGGGGHVWENVQVAHRICNIIKNNHVGREWNNAPLVPSPC